MDKNYKVYMHNCPNNKKYIGITYNIKQRWGKNGYGYRNNRLFKRAIDKYGWENIEHKILYENLTIEEAKQKEIELIKLYKTNNNKYGYNISLGGDLTTTGYKFTKEQKENLSKAKFRPIYCIEDDKYYYTKREINEKKIQGCYKSASGERNTYLGKHYIYIDEIDKYKNGKIILKDNGRKKVICLETKKIYNSINEASKDTNCRENCISGCCNNKLKSTNKLHWQYYDENFDVKKCDEIIKSKKNKSNPLARKVQCIETGIIYENSHIAYKLTGISHILECCKHQRKTAGELHWEFLNE